MDGRARDALKLKARTVRPAMRPVSGGARACTGLCGAPFGQPLCGKTVPVPQRYLGRTPKSPGWERKGPPISSRVRKPKPGRRWWRQRDRPRTAFAMSGGEGGGRRRQNSGGERRGTADGLHGARASPISAPCLRQGVNRKFHGSARGRLPESIPTSSCRLPPRAMGIERDGHPVHVNNMNKCSI